MKHAISTTSSFSHEMNNHLSVIYSQLQQIEYVYKYLSNDNIWIQMKEDFSSVFDMLQRTMKVEDLLSPTKEYTQLSDFLDHLYHSWNPRLTEEHIRFELPREIEQLELPVSEYQLEHIFYNLLSNSFDAITQKEQRSFAPEMISIETELHSKMLEIQLTDTGCGMNPSQLESVFLSGITYKKHGHGIGLPLVLDTMHAIGGSLNITSTPGRGTTVFLYFPL